MQFKILFNKKINEISQLKYIEFVIRWLLFKNNKQQIIKILRAFKFEITKKTFNNFKKHVESIGLYKITNYHATWQKWL